MKKITLITITAVFWCLTIYAQPGWSSQILGNLNDIDSTQIKKCIKAKRACNFEYILIDSTTNLSRLKHLNAATNLVLIIDLYPIPEEFLTVNLNQIKSLHLGGSQLDDVSNLPIMNNLEKLTIGGFQNDTLKILNKLPSLKSLELNYSDSIVSVDHVFQNNNIEELRIRQCKNIKLESGAFNTLKLLGIDDKSAQIKWQDLVNFKNLEFVFLSNMSFESIPENFPKSLKKITISHGITNLETLNKLSKLKNLIELNLRDINLSWKK